MRWLVLGCGYVGTALARALTPEHQVTIARRDPAAVAQLSAELDLPGLVVDLASPITLPPFDVIVDLAPPSADPAAEIRHLIAAAGTARIVYCGSTGVYAPGGGAVVDETWPLQPITDSGRARLLAERALPPSAIILRIAGIHGPGRGLVDRIRAGTYRIIGDGSAHVSRVHVDDLVTAIIAAGHSTLSGAFNVADDEPSPIGEVADTVAAHFGMPPPPRVPASSVSGEVAGMLTADRRISNRRLVEELGVTLQFPSWRQALATSR